MIEAYWISPDGDIYLVPKKHINFIAENLEMFGIFQKGFVELFEKFGEPSGFEGKARNEVMTDAIRQGWVRLRYNPNNHSWTIELRNFDIKTKQNLGKWIEEISGMNYFNTLSYEMNILNIEGEAISSIGYLKDLIRRDVNGQ